MLGSCVWPKRSTTEGTEDTEVQTRSENGFPLRVLRVLCGAELAPSSKRLSDAEVNPPPAGLWCSVDEQARDWIQLIPKVEPNRADWCLVAEARADRVPEIAQIEGPRLFPDVAAVEEQHTAQISLEGGAHLRCKREHAVAPERQARSTQRAHLEPAPPANGRCAAEKVPLREG